MSVSVTVNHPRNLTVSPEHVAKGGRTMVHVDDEDNYRCVLLWVTREVAAQWIEALTPLAEGKL